MKNTDWAFGQALFLLLYVTLFLFSILLYSVSVFLTELSLLVVDLQGQPGFPGLQGPIGPEGPRGAPVSCSMFLSHYD